MFSTKMALQDGYTRPSGIRGYRQPRPAREGNGPDLKCNFQDRAKTILTAEKKLVQITGTAMFPGDIVPDFPTLSGGTVTVFGEERRIEQGMKARNPDGTVNYCQLEVV